MGCDVMDTKDLRSVRNGGSHSAWVFGINAKYFVSYRTIVGFVHKGHGYRTAQKYSSSTTRQLTRHMGVCTEIEPEEFAKKLADALADDGLTTYHVTMAAKTGW